MLVNESTGGPAELVAAGKEAMIDCEHFFDGFKANPDYALACARTAYEAGARWVVLCDTNGGMLTSRLSRSQSQAPGGSVSLGFG